MKDLSKQLAIPPEIATHEYVDGILVDSGTMFTQPFSSVSVVVVNHNLNFNPNVAVIIDDEEIEADVTHNSLNSLTVTFNTAQTGKVVCS